MLSSQSRRSGKRACGTWRGARHTRVLTREHRAILLIDVVDSVRLISIDEERVISRWLDLVEAIENEILPKVKGRLVKSLGDGLLLEFADTHFAVQAAFDIQRTLPVSKCRIQE